MHTQKKVYRINFAFIKKKKNISPLPYSYIDFNDCWSYLDFWPSQNNQIEKGNLSLSCPFLLPAVPQKRFGSADCDTIYTIYVSLWTQTADPNPFRGTHCIFCFFSFILSYSFYRKNPVYFTQYLRHSINIHRVREDTHKK